MSLISYWDDDEDILSLDEDILSLAEVVSNVVESVDAFVDTLLYHAHHIYYWLVDVAPVVITSILRQLGRDAIDDLPLLSWQTKQEIKRWLIDYCGL